MNYSDGQAEIYVSGHALDDMPFDAPDVARATEFWQQINDVRRNGFCSAQPIVLWPKDDGRWIVDRDDTLRFMVAKQVANEFLPNLLHAKVRGVRFILLERRKDEDIALNRPFVHGANGGYKPSASCHHRDSLGAAEIQRVSF